MAQSKSTPMNLSFYVPTSLSSVKSPIASKGPGILTATWKPESRMRNPTQRRVLKCGCKMCIPWRVHGHRHGETCRKKKEESRDVDLSESKTWSLKAEREEWSHNLHVSPAFSIVRGSTGEDMTTLCMIWA